MSVNFDRMKSERREFFVDRMHFHHIAVTSVNLAMIAVNDDAQIIELPMCGEHCRLPDFALLQFTVAGDAENAMIVV